MATMYTRPYITACPGNLLREVNQNLSIGVNLEQIIQTGLGVSEFYFSVPLTVPQETALDQMLLTFACVFGTEFPADTAVVDDQSTGPTVLWSSTKVEETVSAPSGVTAGTYGNASHTGQFTVNTQGKIETAQNIEINVDAGTF